MQINTNTDIILLERVDQKYLLTREGDKIALFNAYIEFEGTNELYNIVYTRKIDFSSIHEFSISELKKVRKDKINLSSPQAFYVSKGKDWTSYIAYDLYLTQNELEITNVSERQQDFGDGETRIYKVYHIKAKQFTTYIYTHKAIAVSGKDKIENNEIKAEKITDIINNIKENPVSLSSKTKKIEILEDYIKQGKDYIAYYKVKEPLPNEFDLVVFDRIVYSEDYKRREKLANELNEILRTHLSHYDISRLEKNGYKIVKTKKTRK